jgi:hypothetical protein
MLRPYDSVLCRYKCRSYYTEGNLTPALSYEERESGLPVDLA